MPPLNVCLLRPESAIISGGNGGIGHRSPEGQQISSNSSDGSNNNTEISNGNVNNAMQNGAGGHQRMMVITTKTVARRRRSPRKFLVYPVMEKLEMNGFGGGERLKLKMKPEEEEEKRLKIKPAEERRIGENGTGEERLIGVNGTDEPIKFDRNKNDDNGTAEIKLKAKMNNGVSWKKPSEQPEAEDKEVPPEIKLEIKPKVDERTKAHLQNGHSNGFFHCEGHCSDASNSTTLQPIRDMEDFWALFENDLKSKNVQRLPSPRKAGRRRKRSETEVAQLIPSVAVQMGGAERWTGVRRAKVIMLGESGVGKTSIAFSYRYGSAPPGESNGLHPHNATIGASYTNFDLTVLNSCSVQLQLWDTAGQERFRCLVPMYLRNTNAAILVYDITCRESFEEVDRWHNELARYAVAGEEPIVALIGNKADQQDQREVAKEEGLAKALRFKARFFFEITASNSEAIRSIFFSLAEQIVRKCEGVENAWEADEAMESGEIGPLSASSASPLIRLGWEPFRDELTTWARHLSCAGRPEERNNGGAIQLETAPNALRHHKSACCGTI